MKTRLTITAFFKTFALLVIFSLLAITKNYSQITYDNFWAKPDILEGSLLQVSDPDHSYSGESQYIRRDQVVSLHYNTDNNSDIGAYTAWSYSLILKIMNGADTTQYFNDTLLIQRNDSLPIYAASQYYDLPWYSLSIRIIDICGKTGIDSTCVTDPHTYPFLPDDIELTAAIIRTEIKGFATMKKTPLSPITPYDPGELEEDCEDVYNDRLDELKRQYKNISRERLEEYFEGITQNISALREAENSIKDKYSQLSNKIKDTLVWTDLQYMFSCDSLLLDSTGLNRLNEITSEKLDKEFKDNYLAWYMTYSHTSLHSTVSVDPAAYLEDFFLAVLNDRMEAVSSDILAAQLPGFIDCYQDMYIDPDNHWSLYYLNRVSDFNGFKDSVLDSLGISDSLYTIYLGNKLGYNIETQQELNTKINTLNAEMYTLCGYSGLYQGGCNDYYNDEITQVQNTAKDISDSVANEIGIIYSIPGNLISQPHSSSIAMMSDLFLLYKPKLDSLDTLFAKCGDSLQYGHILSLIAPVNIYNGGGIIKAFLTTRAGVVDNYYNIHGIIPDSVTWEDMTDSLVYQFGFEGGNMSENKRNLINAAYPSLSSCINYTHNNNVKRSDAIIRELVSQVDSVLDADSAYWPLSVYRYEMAIKQWSNACNEIDSYQLCQEKIDSLIDESQEMCGTYDEPYQSMFGCLAFYDIYLNTLNHMRDSIFSKMDSLTGDFRGITRPGGWNESNGDMVTMFNDYLLPEYAYRFDTLAYNTVIPCFDSTQASQFALHFFPQDQVLEDEYYGMFFRPPYDTLINLPDTMGPTSYVAGNLYGIFGDFVGVYGRYFEQRLQAKALYYFPFIGITPTQMACIDSSFNAVTPSPFETLIGEFVSSMIDEIDAGAVGITSDSIGYRESVFFYSFVTNIINREAKTRYAEIQSGRENCIKSRNVKGDDDDEGPEVIEPSLEAEVAACQSNIEEQYNNLFSSIEPTMDNIPLLMFDSLNMITDTLNADFREWTNYSLNHVDSIWLSCNTDANVLKSVQHAYGSDLAFGALVTFPPAYVLNTDMLYEDGQPTYEYMDSIMTEDSIYFMSFAQYRANWIVDNAAGNTAEYGLLDSCVSDRPDSLAEASYRTAYNLWNNRIDNLVSYLKLQYDSTVIDPDSIEIKIRWGMAETYRRMHNFMLDYIELEQQYNACGEILNKKIIFKPEKDIFENEPKKLVITQGSLLSSTSGILWGIIPNIMNSVTATVAVTTETTDCGSKKFLQWAPIAGAEEYDLEWVYIDDMIYKGAIKANLTANIAYHAFSMSEPTRVTVKENKYPFPAEYPNGKLYFRVRGIARIIDNTYQDYTQPQYFPWVYNWSGYYVSSAPVNFNGTNPFNATFENNINWQWECSFAEEGKFKKVISYHDGINRSRQIVTHLSTDNLSIIGESLYDYEGRPAVQILPYPEKCQELSYRDETRADDGGSAFDKEDFELDSQPNQNMDNSLGASQYYSTLNPFMAVENPLLNMGAIPDAQGYPYTQTTFMPDNTGRPTKAGGVGPTHQVAGDHATRYFYANASETELRRLFGKNVGIASHYKKNAVMDANGQLSVAYVDQEGRTVATALAGLSPDNVMALESNVGMEFLQNLDQNNIYDPVLHQWTVTYNQLNEVPSNAYEFEYQYGMDHVLATNVLPCIICEFDLEIYVTDPLGNRLELTDIVDDGNAVTGTHTIFTKRINNDNSYQLSNACSTSSGLQEIEFKVVMPDINTYTIHKKLIWDKEAAMEELLATLSPTTNSSYADQLQTFIDEYTGNIDFDQCSGMFPGVGFGAIPEDMVDHTNDLAITTQCQSYLYQMIDQIQPYSGPGASPTVNYNVGPPATNSGIYYGDTAFWEKITQLINDGISSPSDPAYISPSALVGYIGANTDATVVNIKNGHQNWSPELKKELAKGHKEYCWYTKCLAYAQSVPFDAEMTTVETLTAGRTGKYMNPLDYDSGLPGTYSGVGNAVGTTTLTPNESGRKVDVIKNNADERTLINDKMLGDDDTGDDLWDRTAVMSGFQGTADITTGEAQWQTFRGGYLQAKNDAFYVSTDDCPFVESATAVVKQPDVPNTEEEMNAANEANSTFWDAGGDHCTSICEENADAWMAQMFTNCAEPIVTPESVSINLNKEQIRQYFIEYCMGQCGPNNPMGIITEQMYEEAMDLDPVADAEDPKMPLQLAVDLYEDEFGSAGNGCMTTASAVETFTYSTTEYTEQCDSVNARLNTASSVLKFIGKINGALDNMDQPLDYVSTQPFTSSGGSSISINTTLDEAYICVPLSISPCIGLAMAPPGCSGTCSFSYSYLNAFNQVTILHPTEVREIIPNFSDWSQIIYPNAPNDDVIQVPVIFDVWAANLGTNTYGSNLSNLSGYLNITLSSCCTGEICRIFPNPWEVEIDTEDYMDSCEAQLIALATQSAQNAFDTWLDEQINVNWQSAKCEIQEKFFYTYTKREYHYTLYYYDQANNLVQTVPPKGVHPLDATSFDAYGNWDGDNPLHDMESRYKFNSLEVAIESETPDGGLSKYKPDLMGRPNESRNRKQLLDAAVLSSNTGNPTEIFSKTEYDYLGRIVKVYEQKNVTVSGTVTSTKSQITETLYDVSVSIGSMGWESSHMRNRVSAINYYETPNVLRHATLYDYDIHGNVKSMVTDVPALQAFGQRYHRLDYFYDLVSGKVNEVHYQPKQKDRIFYRYTYDADNRLTMAESSRDHVAWERDAKYFYYPHGPLKRVEVGHRKVQGADYFYTLHGWLKGVNSQALNQAYDVGHDGDIDLSLNPNAMVARDAFGFSLDYYNGDYAAIGTSGMNHIADMGASDFESAILGQGLYNGNIARMSTSLMKIDQTYMDALGKTYMYDQLNRIRSDGSFITAGLRTSNSWAGVSASDAYTGSYTYDANGNIKTFKRHNGNGDLTDDFSYGYTSVAYNMFNIFNNYIGPMNRLDRVDDAIGDADYAGDMDAQSTGNYAYDAIGNLVADDKEEIDEIKWTVYGKVAGVTRVAGSKKPDMNFYYNGAGQRYLKVVRPKNQTTGALLGKHAWLATYYQHDAQGNIIAVYNIKGGPANCGYDMFLGEHVLYGSARLGVARYDNMHMGYSGGSLAYPYQSGIYACYIDVDEPAIVTDRIPVDGPIDPIGGSTTQTIKTWNPSKFSGEGKPITVANYTPVNTGKGPTKLPTTFVPGKKQYEFSNHLGNVLVTVSDMPIGMEIGTPNNTVEYYVPNVLSTSDYEPFGAPLAERTLKESEGYRFGFNGQEKVDEVYGDANAYDFGARIYDPRIGRWLAVDPKSGDFPAQSPYDFTFDNPIIFTDPDGKEPDDRWRYDFKTNTLQWVSDEGGVQYDVVEFHNIPQATQDGYKLQSSSATLKLNVDQATVGTWDPTYLGTYERSPGLLVIYDQPSVNGQGAIKVDNNDPISFIAFGGLNTIRGALMGQVDDLMILGAQAAKKTYQTYTKQPKNPSDGVYSGKTSGNGTPLENLTKRDKRHHMNNTHGPAQLDKSSTNKDAIRGREQQLIESNGGAQSMGGTSGNAINSVSPNNKKAADYKKAAEGL